MPGLKQSLVIGAVAIVAVAILMNLAPGGLGTLNLTDAAKKNPGNPGPA